MRTRQRLIVCLDGTWNIKDSSTNVVHHFSLVVDGPVPPVGGVQFVQKRLYEKGVGTGVLDSVTGGGFGFGLEEHVREAYNWLVQEFNGDCGDCDEIYVFGFSRGAFTARSLVGFIGCCGLLRRGAPLTVNQLWKAYSLNGRRNEYRTSIWESLLGEPEPSVRPLNELAVDPWLDPREFTPGAEPPDPVFREGVSWEDLNEAERLLVSWSRRVPVTYLGIYDTVGAMGFDALAIPGLSSRLALHHNMRPTRVMQRCRHALAIHEHRSGFRHTPLRAYLENNREEEWNRRLSDWSRRIEQRWFVGAHSNVGGGYENNVLAHRPLHWMLEGAQEAGLVCEKPPRLAERISGGTPRDSYAEFAVPFWTSLFRCKRYYRPIDPYPHFIAPRRDQPGAPGISLVPINEAIDGASLDYWSRPGVAAPPNVVAYARRRLAGGEAQPALRQIATSSPVNPWIGDRMLPSAIVVFWATFVAVGVLAGAKIVWLGYLPPDAIVILSVAAAGFVLVDWAESRMRFNIALGSSSAPARAFCEGLFWTRAVAVILFFTGCAGALCYLAAMGWNIQRPDQLAAPMLRAYSEYFLVPAGAIAGALLANLLNGGQSALRRAAGAVLGGYAAIAASAVVVVLAWCCARIAAPFFPAHGIATHPAAVDVELLQGTGMLFMLQLVFFWLAGGLPWVSEPLTSANLGSIESLRRCATPSAVSGLVRGWVAQVSRPWLGPDESALRQVRDRGSEALWRDMLCYIPVYFAAMVFGMWLAMHSAKGADFGYFFWLPPLLAAAPNLVADLLHLSFLNYHTANPRQAKRGFAPNIATTLLAFALTWMKKVMFTLSAGYITLLMLIFVAEAVTKPEGRGWRGALVIAFTVFMLASLAAIVFGAVKFRLARLWSRLHPASGESPSPAIPRA
jgi:uncharacterized protein (DUF2235 family)